MSIETEMQITLKPNQKNIVVQGHWLNDEHIILINF